MWSCALVTLSREDTEAAYARHHEVHQSRDWAKIADLFAPNGVYREPFFGEQRGPEAIRAFLVDSMDGLDDWTFPVRWTLIGEGRVVYEWVNRLPGTRRDGSYFEFRGISNLLYDDEGRLVLQDDTYDRIEAARVITEGRSRVVERLTGVLFPKGGNPLLNVARRLTGV